MGNDCRNFSVSCCLYWLLSTFFSSFSLIGVLTSTVAYNPEMQAFILLRRYVKEIQTPGWFLTQQVIGVQNLGG